MEKYIEDKKNLYTAIHNFLEESGEGSDLHFQNLIQVITSQQIEENEEEMRQFLEIVKSIGEHHRNLRFNERMNQLLLHYKTQIKQTLSNLEIYQIFKNNKKIVLFLLNQDIITMSKEIFTEMINRTDCKFFIPEIENFVGEAKFKIFKEEILEEDPNFFTNYEEKRQEGENDSYICSLIRQDSVEEFITHVNRYLSPSSKIPESIFETNPFLIANNNTTLIEYSAFFGSIQIFQYLLMNKAELTPSLWLYAIHSNNPELIQLLESYDVHPPKSKDNINSSKDFEKCFIESIKCHHNNIAYYFEDNFLNEEEKHLKKEKFISKCIKYHNYSFFQKDAIVDHGFYYLHFYHYDKLFDLLMKENIIKNKNDPNIQTALENNKAIYHYLLKLQVIRRKSFDFTKIKQIVIPSSVTSIGYFAFRGCSSLKKISIPSSVTSIGSFAFRGCSSLKKIRIPSSVTSIEDCTFYECSSLKNIQIPAFVTSIGEYAFGFCSSLTQITIPSSVKYIGNSCFSGCPLKLIIIPSSIKTRYLSIYDSKIITYFAPMGLLSFDKSDSDSDESDQDS